MTPNTLLQFAVFLAILLLAAKPLGEYMGRVFEREPVFLDPEQEEVGRVSKLVYSYVKEVSNGYILAKKGALKPGDRLKIHGADCVITGRSWLG